MTSKTMGDLVREQGYIFWPFPPPLGGEQFLSKLKYREEFKGGLREKRKKKEKKVIKYT